MMSRSALLSLITLSFALAVLLPAAADAQGTRAPTQAQPLPPLTQSPQAAPPAAHPRAAAPAAVASDETAIARRMDRLEERLVDVQSQTATLETMLGSSGAVAAPSNGDSSLSGDAGSRLGMLEAQMHTLSNQLSDIVQRLQQLEGQSGIAPPPPGRQGAARDRAPALSSTRPAASGEAPPPPVRQSFSTASESPDTEPSDAASNGRYPAVTSSTLPPVDGQDGAPVRTAGVSSSDARALYDQAYATLLKREYRASEAYFAQFLQLYPSDPLAGAAQFWLGESSFVSGDYRQAADMFLKSYTNYPNSDKAPESLLKLGVSLKRLGQGPAACDSFAELERKFPQAKSVIQRAQAERKRSNC
jgi:tol-pal system protein YbgF